jgi:hypothetical protein
MGLKGYRLWVMGQLDSTCRAPPRHPALPVFDVDVVNLQVIREARGVDAEVQVHEAGAQLRVVALQVAFERQTLKPGFHLIGFRLWV